MRTTLTNNVIAISGDFGRIRSTQKLKQWIEAHNGKFATSIGPEVTHLICSRDHWETKSKKVNDALEHGKIKIVSYDWLEDSLLDGRRRPVELYLHKYLAKKAAKAKSIERKKLKPLLEKETIAFQKGCEEAKKNLHCDNYHIYRDTTAFQYSIILTRPNVLENKNERFVLTLYETHTPPYLYATTTTYTHPNIAPRTYTLAPPSSPFHKAFSAFRAFFQSRTGVAWDLRLAWAVAHKDYTSCANSFVTVKVGRPANWPKAPEEDVDLGRVELPPGILSTSPEKEAGLKKRQKTVHFAEPAPAPAPAPANTTPASPADAWSPPPTPSLPGPPKPLPRFFQYLLPRARYISTSTSTSSNPNNTTPPSRRDVVSASPGLWGDTRALELQTKAAFDAAGTNWQDFERRNIVFVGGGRLVGMSGVEGEVE